MSSKRDPGRNKPPSSENIERISSDGGDEARVINRDETIETSPANPIMFHIKCTGVSDIIIEVTGEIGNKESPYILESGSAGRI
jgi:hypothetical protein